MKEKNINNKDLTEKLLVQWLDKQSYLSDIKKQKLYNMGCNYYNNVGFLFEINKTIVRAEKGCKDDINNVTYENEEDKHILIYKNDRM